MADLIIALDPGGTTGACCYDLNRNTVYVGGQYSKFLVLDIVGRLAYKNECLIVAEKFIITPRTGSLSQQPDALKICGALEWIAYQHNGAYEEQMKVSAAKIAPDSRLKEHGLYVPGRGHANDAARHLILVLERKMPGVFDVGGSFETVTIDSWM